MKLWAYGNVIYGNTNVPKCSGCTDPDGSGIIVDDGKHTQSDNKPYNGRTMIDHNVIFGNGGRGVHIYDSDNVTVTRNTLYRNNQDKYASNWRPGEVEANASGNVIVTSNILVTDGAVSSSLTGAHVGVTAEYCKDGKGAILIANNVIFATNGNRTLASYATDNTNAVTISGTLWGDPGFVAASLNGAVANFAITTSSIAYSAVKDIGAL